MQAWETVRAIVGAVYVLLVPGLALSFALFSRGAVDWIERVALSFALSIAVVPLVAFYLNLAGVKIGALNVVLEVAAITVLGLVVATLRRAWRASAGIEPWPTAPEVGDEAVADKTAPVKRAARPRKKKPVPRVRL